MVEQVVLASCARERGIKCQVFMPEPYRATFCAIRRISRSALQCDTVDFEWASNGRTLLVIMSTEMSRDSYYGESRLFIFSMDGKLAMAVPLDKEGYVVEACFRTRALTTAA